MEYALQKTLSSTEMKIIRKKIRMTQKELAVFAGVSVKTVERWESGKSEITGPIVTLLCILQERSEIIEELQIPEMCFLFRMKYMFKKQLCTVIDIDEREQKVRIKNYVKNPMFCAFGKNKNPSYAEYEKFLESRCFPRSRDKMKLILKELNLPFYDPLMIVEKTEGRMSEDDFWIQIERRTEHGQSGR